jgi:hypothetical protein
VDVVVFAEQPHGLGARGGTSELVSSRLSLPGRTGLVLQGPSRSRSEACGPMRCRVVAHRPPASLGRGAAQEGGDFSGAPAVRRGDGR